MDCKEFQYWLTARDIHEKQVPPDAAAHMENCRDCQALFETDNLLEQRICDAFGQEELPRGMAQRISLSLDEKRRPWFSRIPGQKNKSLPALAALAASLVLIVFVFTDFNSTPAFENLNQVSMEAAALHLQRNSQAVFDENQTDQTLALVTKKLGFQVILPDALKPECNITGCRLCAIGECNAAYFTVERNGKPGSLFIMDTEHIHFSMAEGTRFNTSIKGCDTSVWKEHGLIYAMVF